MESRRAALGLGGTAFATPTRMRVSQSLLVVAMPLVFLGGCASGAGRTSAAKTPRAVAAADKPAEAAPDGDKTTVTMVAAPRGKRGQPGCDGSPYALIGSAHGRSEPHWIDCRTGERLDYADAEFDAWFAARHAAKTAPPDAQ
jgi:hypothetical protein